MTNEPSQLPKQQFAASNADTRQQTRMARLEERVKQLEQGKQNNMMPVFRWEQPTTVTGVTASHTWNIELPVPYYAGTGITTTDVFYWFKVGITAVGGTVTGGAITTQVVDTHSWTYTLGSGASATFGPNSGAAASTVYTSSTADKSLLVATPLLLSSPFGSFATIQLSVTKTAGTATSITLNAARLYAIIPTTFQNA